MAKPPELHIESRPKKPSDWSPRPIPQPGPERRTADPKTPTARELAARAQQRASLVAKSDATHVAPPPVAKAAEPQTLDAKKARLAQRRSLVQNARDRAAGMPPGPEQTQLLATASRFEDDTRAVDRARLSQHVYDYYGKQPPPPPPLGYAQITAPNDLANYGLTQKDLAPDKSNFRAALYKSELGDDDKPIVVFRGTIPSSGDDWKNNLQQGIGWKSDYYTRALDIGSKLAESSPGGFETVGHSLGGGLSSAVSAAERVPGDTFNAAGVSEWTLERANASRADARDLVKAYRVEGEALTSLQNWNRQTGRAPDGSAPAWRDWVDDRILPTALGRVRTLAAADAPSWLGRLNPMRPVSLHGAESVVASFEQEKSADSSALSH